MIKDELILRMAVGNRERMPKKAVSFYFWDSHGPFFDVNTDNLAASTLPPMA